MTIPTVPLTLHIPAPLFDLIEAKTIEVNATGVKTSRTSVILKLLYEGLKTTPQEVFGPKDTRPKLSPAEAKKLPRNQRY